MKVVIPIEFLEEDTKTLCSFPFLSFLYKDCTIPLLTSSYVAYLNAGLVLKKNIILEDKSSDIECV
jgi:hypothetical protein